MHDIHDVTMDNNQQIVHYLNGGMLIDLSCAGSNIAETFFKPTQTRGINDGFPSEIAAFNFRYHQARLNENACHDLVLGFDYNACFMATISKRLQNAAATTI